MFSKRHYEAIAEVLRGIKPDHIEPLHDVRLGACKQHEHIVHQLVATFQRDNPRFDRDRFLTACGYGE